ncbi:MAG: HAD family hydrolase [Actinomycetota bacterium]
MTAPPPAAIEAVIFDWGGTLSIWADVDLEDLWRVAAQHLAPDDPDGLLRRLIQVEQRFWKEVEATQTSRSLGDVLASATRELELDVADALLEEAATHHLDAWTPHIRHDPDAAAVLEQLRERGLRIGLLSNTLWPRAYHEHFLERDGLRAAIDARLYTSDMSHTKPHPSAFAAALKALEVGDARRAVFVGDRPFDDIHGANRAGMRTVLRPNPTVPGYDAAPDAIIDDLPSLVAVVDGWLEGGG